MQIKQLLLLCFILFPRESQSQNLIPNPSFEDVNICCELDKPCAPEAWRKNEISEQTYTVGQLAIGGQKGLAYEKVLMKNLESSTNMRTFLEAPILCPLIAGEEYIFSMYVRPENYQLNKIGVRFTDQFYCGSTQYLRSLIPSLTFSLRGKKDWVEVTTHFIANGTEKYIVIGNFKPDKKTKTKPIKPFAGHYNSFRLAYCLVDNVSLSPTSLSNMCDYRIYLDSIYNENHRHSCIQNTYNCGRTGNSIVAKFDTLPEKATYNPADFKTFQNLNYESDDTIPMFKNYTEIDKIFAYLEYNSKLKIEIVGHTDNTGTAEHNYILSYKRANVIAEYLIRKGINKERIKITGYGGQFPIEDKKNPLEKQKDRRIEYKIIQ